MTRGRITADGLQAPGGRRLTLLPDREYWMGASTAPTHIIVTGVTNNTITYCQYPYMADCRIARWIGANLIAQGSRTHLKFYHKYMTLEGIESLQSLLTGGLGSAVRLTDFQRVRVLAAKAQGHETEDLWYVTEEYGSVVGLSGDDAGDEKSAWYRYEIDMDRSSLAKFRKDVRFEILRIA